MKKIACLVLGLSVFGLAMAEESALENPFEFREIPEEPTDNGLVNVEPVIPEVIEPEEPEIKLSYEEKVNKLKRLTEHHYLVAIVNNTEVYFDNQNSVHTYVKLNEIEQELVELKNEYNK
jgi:hypothetical protein